MTTTEIIQIIKAGFTPSHFFKRSSWTKITNVMEYLVNQGLLIKTANAEVKYAILSGEPLTDDDVKHLAEVYMQSPFISHLEVLRNMSAELNLPLNSKRLLSVFMDTTING